MTRLLKPLFHNTSMLLMPSAVTPPPSVSSHSCSPAPALRTQHAPADCSDRQNPPSILVREPTSPPPSAAEMLQGEFDPLHCSPSRRIISQDPPLVSHWSAPPSLNGSPHERTIAPHPSSSSSIPFLSSSSHLSSLTPLLSDLSGPGSEPQTRGQSRSASQLQFRPESQCISSSHRHSLSQPSSTASRPREPRLNLEEAEWGERTVQLSFINEGRPSV